MDSNAYTEIVSTPAGGSAFVDRTLELAEVRMSDDLPAMMVGSLDSVAGAAFNCLDGFDTGMHPAADAQWVIMLRGAIEVTVTDGTSKRFGPGDLVLANDTTGSGHTTTTVGAGPFEALGIPA